MAGIAGQPSIVTSGLVLYLDAANRKSYSGGNLWRDLSGNNYNFTLVNNPVFGNHRGVPCFTFSGADDYATRAGTINHDISSYCTLIITMASIGGNDFASCSRLFSLNDGSANNVDYNTYFTLASCIQTKFGLWYRSSPGGLYPTSDLRTGNDEYKVLCFKWTASNTAYAFLNGVQQNSSAITSPFTYANVQRMTIAMNSSLTIENSNVRVAQVLMYNRELSATEVLQNYNATKTRFGL